MLGPLGTTLKGTLGVGSRDEYMKQALVSETGGGEGGGGGAEVHLARLLTTLIEMYWPVVVPEIGSMICLGESSRTNCW